MPKTAGGLLFGRFPTVMRERSCSKSRCARVRWERRVNVGKDEGVMRKEEKCLKIKAHLCSDSDAEKEFHSD